MIFIIILLSYKGSVLHIETPLGMILKKGKFSISK